MTDILLDTKLDQSQRETAETIRSSAQALLTVINDILDFSKIEAGKLDLEARPFALSAMVEEAVELLAPRANDKAEAALAALLLYVTNPHAPPWRSGRSLAATFPLTTRIDLGHGVHEVDIVRDRDGGYVANIGSDEDRFEVDELGRDTIRFRTDGLMESVRFLRDGDQLYILHRGVTTTVRDLTLASLRRAVGVISQVGSIVLSRWRTMASKSLRSRSGGRLTSSVLRR